MKITARRGRTREQGEPRVAPFPQLSSVYAPFKSPSSRSAFVSSRRRRCSCDVRLDVGFGEGFGALAVTWLCVFRTRRANCRLRIQAWAWLSDEEAHCSPFLFPWLFCMRLNASTSKQAEDKTISNFVVSCIGSFFFLTVLLPDWWTHNSRKVLSISPVPAEVRLDIK